MAIVVGSSAIETGDYTNIANTSVSKENPANGTGTIDHIEIWVFYYGVDKLDVAAFSANGDNLTTNGYVEDLSASDGYNEYDAPGDFSAFNINEGEYIGCFSGANNYICHDVFTSEGYWWKNLDYIPCSNEEFATLTNRILSLYATGTEVAVGLAKMVQIM